MMSRSDSLMNEGSGRPATSLRAVDIAPGFIDAHVHVWTNNVKDYPLESGFAPDDMSPRKYLPEDILRDARPSGVHRVVLIQMSCYGFDNSYMLDAIRHQPNVFRGVAIVDWNSSDPVRTMLEFAKRGVRGFRIYPGNLTCANGWKFRACNVCFDAQRSTSFRYARH